MASSDNDDGYSEEDTAKRRDEALRRALSTMPKQHKDMKKGKSRKRQEENPLPLPRSEPSKHSLLNEVVDTSTACLRRP